MMLNGTNLGKRQHEFNLKVNETSKQNVKFDEIKDLAENSDVDKLFKIDMASKYKNIDYLTEILKSGDSLYISRVLKCSWIYDDEYSTVINPDYLHHNIFPLMSLKMKKKMLYTISMNVKTEIRVTSFYSYCLNTNMPHIANKFLNFTPESFKLDLIHNKMEIINSIEIENINHFIGNSFILAEAYLNKVENWRRHRFLFEVRNLYSVSNNKYLDLLENYILDDGYYDRAVNKLGLRISEDIMKTHKERVLKHASIYLKVLSEHMIIKYSNTNDAKIYATAILPEKPCSFWDNNYCVTNEYILNLIPANKKFEFLKQIFANKYPTTPFEMSINFYQLNYYKYMTIEERELWALRHLNSKQEILGSGKDFIWYKFINFDKAFPEIKKYVHITPDSDKRSEIISVLIHSVKSKRDLQTLLNYYYDRHVNEIISYKESFIDEIIEHHAVFNFDDDCWVPFNKLLYSLEVYNVLNMGYKNDSKYRMISLIYHIINNKELPSALNKYIESEIIFGSFYFCMKTHLDHLDGIKREIVYNYMMKICVDKISRLDIKVYNDDVKSKARNYITFVLDMMKYLKKSDEYIPNIVEKYMKLDSENFYPVAAKNELWLKTGEVLRLLKQDASKAVAVLPKVKHNIECNRNFNLNNFLRKVRIYFANDIAQDYLNFFMGLIAEPDSSSRLTSAAAYGIFQLASEGTKSDFTLKYVPSEGKIDHSEIDRHLLYIREAICRFACYARPPIPLENIMMYIKGDYLQYCLPMFHSYLSNLPLPLCLQFVEKLLDTPVSVQKHGLRLAFKCFETVNLKKVITHSWLKTKNISLRTVIYTSLVNHITGQEDLSTQLELYETLKVFTLSLHEDDHEDVLRLLENWRHLPDKIKDDYLETAWAVIFKFSDNTVNLERKVRLINTLTWKIEYIPKVFLEKLVNEHVRTIVVGKQIQNIYEQTQFTARDIALSKVVIKYLVKYSECKENHETILKLVNFILKHCLKVWNEAHYSKALGYEMYLSRKFCFDFVNDILDEHYSDGRVNYVQINPILENILSELHGALPMPEIYVLVWKIKLSIITNNAIDKCKIHDENKSETLKEMCNNYASELCDLIKEFAKRQMYYKFFVNEIAIIVKKNITDIVSFIDSKFVYNSYLFNYVDNMCVVVSNSLAKNIMVETISLAIMILPTSGCDESYDYKELISAIKMLDNAEIQCLLNQKFMSCNFKKF